MNWVDALLALLILLSVWAGIRRGVFLAGADLFALAASLVCAFHLYPYAVHLAEQQGLQWGVWTPPAAFLLVYIVVRIALGALFIRIVGRVPGSIHRHGASRLLGTLPGLANGLIDATIVSMLLLALPVSDAINKTVRESVLASRFAGPAEWLEAALRPIFDPALDQTLNRLTIRPDSREFVRLPFTMVDPKPRPDLESAMLDMLNEERRAQNLPPLRPDPDVADVARAHSIDMFARGYFSHVSPEGADAFERMRDAGLRFRAAGENLALARTLPMAHQGLMDSPGHRANILRPAFGRVGIGIVDGGRYGIMVTQNFRN